MRMKSVELIKNYLSKYLAQQLPNQKIEVGYDPEYYKTPYLLLSCIKIEPQQNMEREDYCVCDIMLTYIQNDENWDNFKTTHSVIHELLEEAPNFAEGVLGVLCLESKIRYSKHMISAQYQYQALI